MVINFDQYRQKQLDRDAYRQGLIDRIVLHYRELGSEADAENFYMQHVKRGFPVSILENIVARLSVGRVSGE